MASTGRRDDRSEQADGWRRLYRTRQWQGIRTAQLSAQPLCAMCLEDGRVTSATICNHIDKASKGTVEGFYAGPFNSLCKTHHDATQQSYERTGLMRGCDEDGWPIDKRHGWNAL